ncbi:MAG: exodeoxyribonuclease VII large subunit [Candidatus Coatesbacteria bacterium]|nr:exodeoxyribonuclease VII large subunit [Candidatus Coatesbacteria bacterium]
MKDLELDFTAQKAQEFQEGRKIYQVSELSAEIKGLLQARFTDIWVEGEITDFKRSAAGHLYMRLKDDKAQIGAVMFRNKAIFLRFKPENGLAVIAKGSVSCYPPSSSYQIIVDYFEPKGIGALQLAFEQLKRKLQSEGLFDPERKKPIPKMPKTIGVVTSPTGAAIRDILNVTSRRFCSAHVILYPVLVQGDKAPAEIAHAIDEMNRLGLVEVLIVGRGGGAAIDLWAFNEESVARAIARSVIPVISAVGHEVDFTISDFVADLRAPTPSAAAELVVQSRAELLAKVDAMRSRVLKMTADRVAFLSQKHKTLATALRLNSPERPIEVLMQRVDEFDNRLRRGLLAYIERKRQKIENLTSRQSPRLLTKRVEVLDANLKSCTNRLKRSMLARMELAETRFSAVRKQLSSLKPQNVMKRGYAICQDVATGRSISRAREARLGSTILLTLSDGSLGCQVNDVSISEDIISNEIR